MQESCISDVWRRLGLKVSMIHTRRTSGYFARFVYACFVTSKVHWRIFPIIFHFNGRYILWNLDKSQFHYVFVLTSVSNVTTKIKHNSKMKENGFMCLFLHSGRLHRQKLLVLAADGVNSSKIKQFTYFLYLLRYIFTVMIHRVQHIYQTVSGFSTMAGCITLGFTMVLQTDQWLTEIIYLEIRGKHAPVYL